MRKIFFISTMIAAIMFVASTVGFAQDAKEIKKEREQIRKMTKSELNAKVSKTATKEAKRYIKEGWKVMPGALPIEKQLERVYQMQYDYDEDMFPKYIMGDASSIAENYDGGKAQALELAKQNLAGQIHSEITMLIETTVANKQMEAGTATTVVESVGAAKNLISQSLGKVIPVVEMYRELKNKNKEVRVFIAYSAAMAKETAKKAVRNDLEKKGGNLHEQLDKVLGF